MASSLTIQLDLRDWPDSPRLGVLGKTDGRLEIAASGPLNEPISVAGMRRAIDLIILTWLEPPLGVNPTDSILDLFATLVHE